MPLAQDWTRIISTSVVPVAIISACALLCLALYNRLSSLVSRLRGFQRERLTEFEAYARHVHSTSVDASSVLLHQKMLDMLREQTARVYRRAKLLRAALLQLLSAITCLVLCSLCMGTSLVIPASDQIIGYAAEGFFVLGMILLLGGAVLSIIEMWYALEPVELETQFVNSLSIEFESGTQGEE